MAVQVIDRDNKPNLFASAESWRIDEEGFLLLLRRFKDTSEHSLVATFNKVAWQSVAFIPPDEEEDDPKLRVQAAQKRLRDAQADLVDAQTQAQKKLHSMRQDIQGF